MQSRAVRHAQQTQFFQVQVARPLGIPRCLCNSQGTGKPRWQLSNLKRLYQESRSIMF
jgi:hypothetical protein